ncbi:MAG: GMC family oxidoreductase N-terminal domain-containing protein [Bacteroidetes bacterium]|nr:GMC family oxidoreductase N-terminal domain-containing protein [Bacteroidota bacterium]
MENLDFDYIIIGSGFGGSVSALRLSEKGYKVLVVEKGKWYRQDDFAKTNWQLSKWLWIPALRWYGIMKITIFRHVGIISGTGVGGGSLVYANTLPIPKSAFFESGSWARLADWKTDLQPYYQLALRMLGAAPNPNFFDGEHALQKLAREIGQENQLKATEVAVYFGSKGPKHSDPYFDGKGPARDACIFCGACMTGCRHNAKNTLDKNYLHLAQQEGASILAEHEVFRVKPLDGAQGATGYRVYVRRKTRFFGKKIQFTTKGVVFAGGVLGTVPLLLKLKKQDLPGLSDKVGREVRTNNESLIAVTQLDGSTDQSKGIAIGAILHTDAHSHLELCRYGAGSGFWRMAFLPFVDGRNLPVRLIKMTWEVISHPKAYWKYIWVKDWAKSSAVMLFMQTLNSTVTFHRNWWGGIKTAVVGAEKPTAFIPHAIELARKFEKIMNGKAMAFGLTPLAGIPGTAHILGGAVMGHSRETGVIDSHNRVFGYENLLICDGSMISANPGVNPALSITAISEHAMAQIPDKKRRQ